MATIVNIVKQNNTIFKIKMKYLKVHRKKYFFRKAFLTNMETVNLGKKG